VRFADHLVEDLEISYALLRRGIEPVFVAGACVRSPLPDERRGMSVQKLRWEAGQVGMWSRVPGILLSLLGRGRLRAAVAVVDWSGPPVAMGAMWAMGLVFAVGVGTALRWTPVWLLSVPAAAIAMLAMYVVVGGIQVSGTAAVGRLIVALPRFLFWKLELYGRMLLGRGPRTWERTPRGVEVGK
jgi:hypothetical protein